MYKIGRSNEHLAKELQKIRSKLKLPKDYVDFLYEYGFGDINELIYFNQPDENFIVSNFRDDLDLWIWTEKEKYNVLKGVVIGGTSNGDIITIINAKKPYLILPRHSEIPHYFITLKEVMTYYISEYDIKEQYFDFSYESEIIHFVVNTNSFDRIYKSITDAIDVDKKFDNGFNQIKYVIQKIGGWLYFDNSQRNSVRIKYQKAFQNEANELISLIKEMINKNV